MTVLEIDAPLDADLGNVSSIAKAARVLRALARAEDGEAGVTDLAVLADLPKSTTHRVLAELIGEGFVCRSGQRYRLGTGWFALLQSALNSSEWLRLVEQARRPLASLFERTGATVHFGVLDGDEVLYLEKLTARGGTAVPTRVGSHMPATCTAVGKALLAYSSREVQLRVLSKPLPRISPRSIALPRLIAGQLDEIRATGLARDLEESQPGVFCLAAPIFRQGVVVAAVSVTRVGSAGFVRSDENEVRLAAKRIEEWLTPSGDSYSRAGMARNAS
jgi:DNA-binding IclR family transcriptional regulator